MFVCVNERVIKRETETESVWRGPGGQDITKNAKPEVSQTRGV